MGDFRITVNAVGGHGCQREVKDGGTVHGCGSMICPDCLTTEYLQKMRLAGVNLKDAKIEHWPGQPSQVTDEYSISAGPYTDAAAYERAHAAKPGRVRHGSF